MPMLAAVLSTVALLAPEHPPSPPAPGNHPPWLRVLVPAGLEMEETEQVIHVRPLRELRVKLAASDAEGDPVTVRAVRLPAGARFSAQQLTVTWTPAAGDVGTHAVTLEANDGKAAAPRTFDIEVAANRPPHFNGDYELQGKTGEELKENLYASDPDEDALRYRAEGLPPGATFDPEGARLRWRPREDQTGRYEIRVFVSDGEKEVSHAFTLEILEEWTSFMLPGARYGVFAPVAADEVGVLHGVSLEVAIAAWIHRNENRGPSHGRVYLRLDLLSSTTPGEPLGLIYAAGFDLSFERNPQRHWLIPFYALEAGGLVHPSHGHFFQATALLGAHLWTSRNIFVDASAGYLVAPAELQRFRGWRASVGTNITFW